MVSRDKLDTKDMDQGMEARQHSRGRRVGGTGCLGGGSSVRHREAGAKVQVFLGSS